MRHHRSKTLVGVVTALCLAHATHADVVHVNAAQTLDFEFQDGLTWATAYKFLEDGLNFSDNGDQIWVATGIYRPSAFGDRDLSFLVVEGRAVIGGFLPGATSVDQRDPVAHPTILSGEIGNPNSTLDNSKHVVRLAGTAPRLDGVIIEDGSSIGTGLTNGAGIFATSTTSFEVERCVIRRCQANSRGGAAGLYTSTGTFRFCTFEDNHAGNNAGACDVQSLAVHFLACRFLGNTSDSAGALALLGSPNGSVVNCVFSGNKALSGNGGAISTSANGNVITCSTFVNNSASLLGGAISFGASSSNTQITNCLFASNTAPNGPNIQPFGTPIIQHNGFDAFSIAGTGNVIVQAQFADADGADNLAGTVDDDLSLTSISGAIDHGCGTLLPLDTFDLDDDGNVSEPLPVDIGGGPRLIDEFPPNSGLGALPYLDFGADEAVVEYIVLHVNANVRGGNGDGTTWENAFKSLQDAIIAAMSGGFFKPVEIWVAQGIYVPTESTDRDASFAPSGNVKLYGGFEGGETSRSQRLPFKRPTILSGEIGSGDLEDNSFHVVRLSGDNVFAETLLDGFVITGGNADGNGLTEVGGGLLVDNVARPTIRNCRFLGNRADIGGGAICVLDSGSGASLFNCYLAENVAGRGGALYIVDGANHNEIVNCTIASNHADVGGGVFAADAGTLVTILNTLFTLNTHGEADDETAHVFDVSGATVKIAHSALPCGAAIVSEGHVGLPPQLKDLDGDDDVVGTLDDVLLLAEGSPCIDAGAASFNSTAVPLDTFDLDDDGDVTELAPIDIDASPRLIDGPNMPDADPGFPIDIGADEAEAYVAQPSSPGDYNGDGHINGADLATLLGFWGGTSSDADLNGDCIINGADLAVLLGGWTG
jgi:hypothetical protein